MIFQFCHVFDIHFIPILKEKWHFIYYFYILGMTIDELRKEYEINEELTPELEETIKKKHAKIFEDTKFSFNDWIFFFIIYKKEKCFIYLTCLNLLYLFFYI